MQKRPSRSSISAKKMEDEGHPRGGDSGGSVEQIGSRTDGRRPTLKAGPNSSKIGCGSDLLLDLRVR